MATIKISELPVATSLANVDVSPVVQGGATKQANVTVIATAVNTILGLGTMSTQASSNVNVTGGAINSVALNNVTIDATTLSNVNVTGGVINSATLNNVTVDVANLSNVNIASGNAVFTVANAATSTITTATVTNLTSSNVSVTGGTVNTTSLVLQSYANAALSNAADAVNTTGKEAGKIVWNTDALKIYVANGSANVAVWYDAVGANAITPS